MNFFKNRPLASCCFAFIAVYFLLFYIPSFAKLVVAVAAITVGILFFKKKLFVTVVSIFVIASCVFGYLYYDVHIAKASELPDATYTEFEILDISFCNDKIAYVDGLDKEGCKIHYTVYSPPEIEIGDVIGGNVVYNRIEPIDDFDIERYYNSKDIWLEGEIRTPEIIGHNDDFIRDSVVLVHNFCTDAFDKYTDDDTSGVLAALSVGEKSGLDESIKRDFQRAGLSHMLAISGMHLSVIMGCIIFFSDIFSLNKRWSSGIVILICVCYMFIAGLSSSILRAGIMFIIMSFGGVFRRVSDSLTNLMVSGVLIILFSPSAVFDTGLILSFTATFGIIVVVGQFMRKVKDVKKGIFRKLWHCIQVSLMTTLAAYSFSFIPMLMLFDSFSLVSILSNLLVSPVITLILFGIPLFLVLSRFSFAGTVIGYIIDALSGLMIWMVEKIASIPNAVVDLRHPYVSYTLIAIVVGIFLIFVFKKHNAYLLPYLCWFVTFTVAFTVYNFNLLDKCDVILYSEASSDAIVMRNANGCVYLDLGKGSKAAEERAIKLIRDEAYACELDYWVITGYSNGIVGAACDNMNEFYIRNLCIPTPYDKLSNAASKELEYYAEKEHVNIIYYDYCDSFKINNIDICVYEPVLFEESSVTIPSVDIEYGTRRISYVGCGYFDHCDPRDVYDILYVGECGTKRKQKSSPDIGCAASYVAENNDIAAKNIDNRRFVFSDEENRIKIRISQ